MASFGMDLQPRPSGSATPTAARCSFRTYRHLYEDERRRQADLFGSASRPAWTRSGQRASLSPIFSSTTRMRTMGAPGIEPGTSRV
jgi:hypothetical protein